MKILHKFSLILLSVIIILTSVVSVYAVWDQYKVNTNYTAERADIITEKTENASTTAIESTTAIASTTASSANAANSGTDEPASVASNSAFEINAATAARATNSAQKLSTASAPLLSAISVNPEVVGWLKVDGTGVDYAVARSNTTNSKYINTAIDGISYSLAGSIYLDYRNSADFSDFNNVIYGHNMSGGNMFGDIKKFADSSFFNANTTGTLETTNGSYTLESVAYIVTLAFDTTVITPTVRDRDVWLQTIQDKATNFRDIDISSDDTFLTLVTCGNEYTNARNILIVRIKGHSTPPVTPTTDPTPSVIPVVSQDSVNFRIPAEKLVTGDIPAPSETFSFVLTASDPSYPMPEGSSSGTKTVSRSGSGSVDFGEIEFSRPGMYYYTVSEVAGKTSGYTYDSTVYKVSIAVLNGTTTYSISTVIQAVGALAKTDCATFTNTYSDSGTTPTNPPEPVTNPPTPTTKPSTPTTKPSTPTTKPSTPTTKPSTPTTKPSTPTTKPVTPTTKPNTPTTNPSTPTTNPSTPTTNPTPTPTNPTPVSTPTPQTGDLTDNIPIILLFIALAAAIVVLLMRMFISRNKSRGRY